MPPFDEMQPIMETLVTMEDVPLDILSSFCSTFPLNLSAAYVARAHFLITSTDATNLKRRIPRVLEVLQRLSPIEVHSYALQLLVISISNYAVIYLEIRDLEIDLSSASRFFFVLSFRHCCFNYYINRKKELSYP